MGVSNDTRITTDKELITIPLGALKYLYRKGALANNVVCEINLKSLKKVNKPKIVDLMVAESRLEYYSGKTKGFSKSSDLIKHLMT